MSQAHILPSDRQYLRSRICGLAGVKAICPHVDRSSHEGAPAIKGPHSRETPQIKSVHQESQKAAISQNGRLHKVCLEHTEFLRLVLLLRVSMLLLLLQRELILLLRLFVTIKHAMLSTLLQFPRSAFGNATFAKPIRGILHEL